MLTIPQTRYILDCANRAPSADNHHRFLIEFTDDGLLLWSRDKEISLLRGYKRSLLLLSLGAVAENIMIGASRFGISAEIVPLPEDMDEALICRIRWMQREKDAELDPLDNAIVGRHTNRKFYHGPPLSPEHLIKLVDAAESAGCRLIWFDSRQLRSKALRLIRIAETARFRNHPLHTELFSAIRFDVGWSSTCPDGLPPGSLEVEAPMRPIFKMLRHWPIMRMLNLIGAHNMLGLRAAWLPCARSPHLGMIITLPGEGIQSFTAGRAFERVWLQATLFGLALQPLPASVLYTQGDGGGKILDTRLTACLRGGWKGLVGDAVPQMLFRLGHAPKPSVLSGRLAADRLLKNPKTVSTI